MQMTNCIWWYSVTSLHFAGLDTVFVKRKNQVSGLPFKTGALRGGEMAIVETKLEPYDEI